MAEIAAGPLAAAARSAARAGLWDQAVSLLSAAAGADCAERAVLAVAEAEVAVDQDFWCRTDRGASALSRARAAVAGAPADPVLAFDVEFAQLRASYTRELFGVPRFGPDGREAAVIDELAEWAARLRAAAPDRGRGAAATFYAGLIADNLRGDANAARPMFAAALAEAEAAGDGLTESEALRHLGYHLSQDGEVERARQMWERSAELRQRAGAVPFALSQQLLLAGLVRDTGSPAEARAIAGQVRGWAHALGVVTLEAGAASLCEVPS